MFVLIISNCGEKPAPLEQPQPKLVKVLTIKSPEEIITRKYPGKVEANKDATLSFQVSGIISSLPIEKGQEVKKGDLIAKLDPVDYKLKLQEAIAVRDEKKVNLNRTAKLLEKGYTAQAEYDKFKAQLDVSEANVSLAKQNLKYTTLRAPFDGRIADTFIENHQYINSKDPIALLYNTNNIDITINVPENIMIRIKDTETINKFAIFDSAPDKQYEIEFKDVVLQADPKTQTYKVYMTLPNPNDINVLPGMTATLTFEFRMKDTNPDINSFLIPISSVFTNESNKSFVWKVDENNKISSSEVTKGEIKDNQLQIVSGLKTGDTIVAAGVHLLREGMIIRQYNTEINNN